MKKNFLVTTGIINTWEFNENNFCLGKWCEFYEFNNFDKKNFKKKSIDQISIIRNTNYHWKSNEKKFRDYKYLSEQLENLLDIISENLSIIHNVKENKEYWRIIVSNWLSQYLTTMFDRWGLIRTFFVKNEGIKFYSNYILLKDFNQTPNSHYDFIISTQNDKWNHLIFLRILNFLNITNLLLKGKKDLYEERKKKNIIKTKKEITAFHILKLIDRLISKISFRFNKIIFDSFYFPTKEFLKMSLKLKLIPSKYEKLFKFDFKNNTLEEDNKRIEFKNLLTKNNTQDKFIKFVLSNLHKDIPKSYIENFVNIKKKIYPFAKNKKIIISMHSIFVNDNFKTYIAETKKVGSKYIYSDHGGGLTDMHASSRSQKDEGDNLYPFFNFFKKVPDKIIRWDNIVQNRNNFINLSPTLPIIKFKNKKRKGTNCSIIFFESLKYKLKFGHGAGLEKDIEIFDKLIQFTNNLDSEIKKKVKFRVKDTFIKNEGYNFENRFSKIFGKNSVDKISFKNSFEKVILNSKLIIMTYPQTAFSEAMYCNVPTILITEKHFWRFSTIASDTFDEFKNSKIAFENFNEAKVHINENWNNLNLWWESADVQAARKKFLTHFFNVKKDWDKEWFDYIYYFSSSFK